MSKLQLKNKIQSAKNTATITKAMEMVATSKIRRCREKQRSMRAYHEGVLSILGHVSSRSSHFSPKLKKFFETPKKEACVLYIVVGTDRGLCGGLNAQLFRSVETHIASRRTKGELEQKFISFGRRMSTMVLSSNYEQIASADALEKPSMATIVGLSYSVFDLFEKGEIDSVYIAYNRYVSGITQHPVLERALPIEPKAESKSTSDYEYEPGISTMLPQLLRRYFEASLLHSLYENVSSEQAARMVAMKSATENALEMVESLEMAFHKARQARITQEITEIIGGSNALSH